MTSTRTMHTIYLGDARAVLPRLAPESVHLVVTSPPYWSIKSYARDERTREREIGVSQSFDDYIASLDDVWRECARVLHPGCRLAVNVGDQFLRARDHGRYRILPIGAKVTLGGMAAGLDYMGSIIWRKVTTTRTSGGGVLMGSIHFPRDGHVTYEHEYIVLFRKQGKGPRPKDPAVLEASRIPRAERSLWFRGSWQIAPERMKEHAAMFPVELPRRLIAMYTFAGDTVLDPFLGSGTTALAARETGRSSVGIELCPEHLPVIEGKMGAGLFGGRVEVVRG